MTTALLRAELTKLRTVRGPMVALGLVLAVGAGIGALDGLSARGAIESHNPMLRPDFTAEQAGLVGIQYALLPMIVFGVLLVTGEYGSGMIGVSLLAVPRRGRFYAAKLTVGALAAVAVTVPATVASVTVTQLALGPYGTSPLAPGVPAAMAGAVVYLTLMCLLTAGVTVMARNALVPLAVLLPLVMAGSQILSVIDATSELSRFLPDRAGAQLTLVEPGAGDMGPAAGLAVLLAWTVAALAGGHLALRRRDV
ncbi:ABC transporter permease [Microbispora sp. NPDC049125]|uniref:ABC transporter permease n=1 Tax=Microbispora sp. NPDC049125 TaxID=3154929 RepID=UPI0034675CD4